MIDPSIIDTAPFSGDQVARRALFLAYEASTVTCLGRLHATEGVTECDVWDHCADPSRVSADYVAGRMVKLNFRFTKTTVVVADSVPPRVDYQSWATTYPTYHSLFEAAMASLRVENGGQGRSSSDIADSGSAIGWLLIVLLAFAAVRLALELEGAL